MTEKHIASPEQHHLPEYGTAEHEKKLQESLESRAASAEKLDTEALAAKAKELAPLGKEFTPIESEQPQSDSSFWQSKELRSQAFQRVLNHARSKLSAPERQFSKVVHQPVVEKTSEWAAKTVARPSGILVGGILSFICSVVAYFVAKRIGGEFRYSIFALAFVAGFGIGLIVELIWRVTAKNKEY